MCTPEIDTHTYSQVPDDYLIDDSFTLSYDLAEDKWASTHDYVPDFALVLRNRKHLQFFARGMYEMNVGRYGTYFGSNFSSYITPTLSPRLKQQETVLYPFSINSINWNMDVEKDNIRLLENTFTLISVHNSYQGTRELPLVPFVESCSFKEQYGTANVRRIKNRWLYNYVFNEKHSSLLRTWEERVDRFLTRNTEDKSCKWEDLFRTPMMDDFVIVKLTFDNRNNYQFFFYELNMDIDVVRQ